MFLSEEESKLSEEYISHGFAIRAAANAEALKYLQAQVAAIARSVAGIASDESDMQLLNNIHRHVPVASLNDFRVQVIQRMNEVPDFRLKYFLSAKPYLEAIVGNELAMQLRVNLSIQFPGDTSSLLPVHADTWSGDSPYEVVLWLPLVDCYGTKAMYLMSPAGYDALRKDFATRSGKTSEDLYNAIRDEVTFLKIRFGEVLVFDQGLPHGNRINEENETRWSMNCRFKAVFTPYGDKKIGEFFDPITLRAASKVGMNYKFPVLK